MNKITVSEIAKQQKELMFKMAADGQPNRNGRVYTQEAVAHAFANYERDHSVSPRLQRLQQNWDAAQDEFPLYFTRRKWRKFNYRQAKKYLRLAAFWE